MTPQYLGSRLGEFMPHLERGVRRANRFSISDIVQNVQDGRMQLWAATAEDTILGVLVTVIEETYQGRVCVLALAGGDQMHRWLPLYQELESWAANWEGCVRIEIPGRIGWQKVLPGFELSHVVLKKELNDE